jgi:hypothetical protein
MEIAKVNALFAWHEKGVRFFVNGISHF